jgi:hypothetical protein
MQLELLWRMGVCVLAARASALIVVVWGVK